MRCSWLPKRRKSVWTKLSGDCAVTNLRSLRLTGHLPVGFMLRSLEDRLHSLHSLSSMYLAGGDPENWHPEEAVQALTALNNLRQLEIRFRKYVSTYCVFTAAVLLTRRLQLISETNTKRNVWNYFCAVIRKKWIRLSWNPSAI